MSKSDPKPHRNGTVPVMSSHTSQPSQHTTINQDHSYYGDIARKYWLKSAKIGNVKPSVVKGEIWDQLEKENFAYASLQALENLQILERYLWPGYSEKSSNYHVLILAIIVTVKRRESLPAWSYFESSPSNFASFFRRVLSLSVDLSLPSSVRRYILSFITTAFQSLDNALVRQECAPLVSIGIWTNLHDDEAREAVFNSYLRLRKVWRAATKKFDQSEVSTQQQLRFDRAWLFTLLLDLINRLYDDSKGDQGKENILYCERFLELLSDLLSQLPTRRYVKTLLHDLNILPVIKLSYLYDTDSNQLLRDLYKLLSHYFHFPVDDHEEKQLSTGETEDAHNKKLTRLQRIAYKNFDNKLRILALSNFGSLKQRSDLENHFETLDLDDLMKLCKLLGLRTLYPENVTLVRDRAFFLEVLISEYEHVPAFQDNVRNLAILPTARTLYESTYLRNEDYNGEKPLAIPKLNLQYLTINDFLWRSFILFRHESFFSIRSDVETAIKRLAPKIIEGDARFTGSTKMALQTINGVAVVSEEPPKVGEFIPAEVRAEVILNVRQVSYSVLQEWENLKTNDVVYLLSVKPQETLHKKQNGNTIESPEKAALQHLRVAQVIQVQDERGRSMRDRKPVNSAEQESQYYERQPRQFRLILRLDNIAYHHDNKQKQKGIPDIYPTLNVVMRRRARENNFKSILESIKKLTLSDISIPRWLQDVFLGYGDPSKATYQNLSNRLSVVDFRDTFLDWQHLVESFPGQPLEPNDDIDSSFGPPYVLDYVTSQSPIPEGPPSKRRKKAQLNSDRSNSNTIKVSTYKPPNNGPYPIDIPKLNTIRFTPAQIKAVSSGVQPGLSIIVGPPGTGKTDTTTQIISNLYHNFPTQRILLIAHSNQALNQLFQKIMALDIDERHLLRLGHGEEELETDSSFSKYGRVDSFLERGYQYLNEVTRLAASIYAPGAHGNSCETASYFDSVYITPMWTKYWESIQGDNITMEQVVETFPFHKYFSNVPQALFPHDVTKEQAVDIVTGCHRHIEKIFSELADIRPFEILRNPKDKANYLLIREARIIAMTATHAAIRRQEIVDLGFHYDTVVMEEAAQITEIETFIPLALQKSKADGSSVPLQRIVLVGDHFQNAPVIQNLAFRQYANLEQSMFLRLVRLGIPVITLDAQGRARSSISELYRWRYSALDSLPDVVAQPEFTLANAGLRHEFQFIDVPDYKGSGEAEPTPHFLQNLGEAEYAVALYMYMRLLGYPASKISILTMYSGQRALIRDVLGHRCKNNKIFGLPKNISTVDKFQGEQNDYIILSLVRTKRAGYTRDLRRLTVALSRARLGLYVLGRESLFSNILEVQPAFQVLLSKPTTLQVVPGELYGKVTRNIEQEVVDGVVDMTGLEHLGQYVFDMTQTRIQMLKEGTEVLKVDNHEYQNGEEVDDDE